MLYCHINVNATDLFFFLQASGILLLLKMELYGNESCCFFCDCCFQLFYLSHSNKFSSWSLCHIFFPYFQRLVQGLFKKILLGQFIKWNRCFSAVFNWNNFNLITWIYTENLLCTKFILCSKVETMASKI